MRFDYGKDVCYPALSYWRSLTHCTYEPAGLGRKARERQKAGVFKWLGPGAAAVVASPPRAAGPLCARPVTSPPVPGWRGRGVERGESETCCRRAWVDPRHLEGSPFARVGINNHRQKGRGQALNGLWLSQNPTSLSLQEMFPEESSRVAIAVGHRRALKKLS